MAHGEASAIISAPSAAVFDLLHDYGPGWSGTLCCRQPAGRRPYRGRRWRDVGLRGTAVAGRIALKTVYVTFERPSVAAVKISTAAILRVVGGFDPPRGPAGRLFAHHLQIPFHGAPAPAALHPRAADAARVPVGDAQAPAGAAALVRGAGALARRSHFPTMPCASPLS
jgi:hypothetical protein